MANQWIWGISSDSKNKEAAFAFEMWFSSPRVSLQASTLPNSLVDPHRYSHYESPFYRSLWPNAGNYLDTLRDAAKYATLDFKVLGGTEYQDAVDRAVTSVMAGKDIQASLDEAAKKMDAITDRFGRERVKATYIDCLKLRKQIRELAK
jgi:multiple sugar transport system substrate-binding protein